MEISEVLLAEELARRGQRVDLILSNHPVGKALAGLAEVMEMQKEILSRFGVPIAIAEGLLEERRSDPNFYAP